MSKTVADLTHDPKNPRKISEEQLEALGKAMEEFGDLSGIVYNRTTKQLVGGHQRTKHMPPEAEVHIEHKRSKPNKQGTVATGYVLIGTERWGYREVRWDAEKETAANIAANKHGGEWDVPLLSDALFELQEVGFDMDLTGFSAADLEMYGTGADDPTDEDGTVPTPPSSPVSRRGEIYELGPHRLMCGDCRSADDWRTLMGENTINVVVTSPPYAAQRKYDESSDFNPIPPDEYNDWFDAVQAELARHLAHDGSYFLNIKEHCEDGQRVLYVKDLTIRHVREWGWRLVDELCWTHGGTPKAVINRFKNGWEPVFHFTRNAKAKFRPKNVTHATQDTVDWGGRHPSQDDGHGLRQPASNAALQGSSAGGKAIHDAVASKSPGFAYPSNVLSPGKNKEALGHGAAFPVALPEFFIKAYSDAGDIIADPFMGSGTTLIAAERQGRVCYGMEISPAYCDVIRERYANLVAE